MKKIEAKIIADSTCNGHRITTMLLTFPRFILAEAKTHRIISGLHGEVEVLEDISINSFREGSKNSASSRAIPFEKMVKMVEEDPFIPIAWQKDHKGMQGSEYFNIEEEIEIQKRKWLQGKDAAVVIAKRLHENNVTKQLCNRLLEPFMWHTVLVTATEWENFFELRCPKYHTPVSGDGFYFKSKKDCINNHSDSENIKKLENMTEIEWLQINTSQAEIHIQALAEAMWDAMNESTPKELKAGEYHIPFLDASYYKDDRSPLLPFLYKTNAKPDTLLNYSIKIATARCARLSYMTFDGEIDYEKDLKLHNTLLESHHMSPFEHCARAMSDEEYFYFIKGYLEDQGAERENLEDGYSEEIYIPKNTQGCCNNFRGFIQYRYLIDDGQKI